MSGAFDFIARSNISAQTEQTEAEHHWGAEGNYLCLWLGSAPQSTPHKAICGSSSTVISGSVMAVSPRTGLGTIFSLYDPKLSPLLCICLLTALCRIKLRGPHNTTATVPSWVVLIAKIAPSVILIVNVCAENVKRCLSTISPQWLKLSQKSIIYIVPSLMWRSHFRLTLKESQHYGNYTYSPSGGEN